MRRQRRPELMDRLEADPEELAKSLDDLRTVNRWLGGKRAALRHLLDLARRVPSRPMRVLDVGTGIADIPRALLEAASREGVEMAVVGVARHPETISRARTATAGLAGLEIVEGDALALPFEAGRFDLAMCNTTLHHFDDEEARRVLAELDRVATWGVVVTDLSRSRAALLGALALSVTVWRRHPITRHDGPWSVRAAFTPRELSRLAVEAGLQGVEVRREPVFRLSLVADRTPRVASRRRRTSESSMDAEGVESGSL